MAHGKKAHLAPQIPMLPGSRVRAQLPKDLPATFLPLQDFGVSAEHTGFPGTISASAETIIPLWLEVGAKEIWRVPVHHEEGKEICTGIYTTRPAGTIVLEPQKAP